MFLGRQMLGRLHELEPRIVMSSKPAHDERMDDWSRGRLVIAGEDG